MIGRLKNSARIWGKGYFQLFAWREFFPDRILVQKGGEREGGSDCCELYNEPCIGGIIWFHKSLYLNDDHCVKIPEIHLFTLLLARARFVFVFVSIFCFVFCICFNILLGNLTVVRSSELGTSCRSRTSPSWERTPHKNRTEPPTRHLLSLDKPARLKIVPLCQMRYKNTISGTPPTRRLLSSTLWKSPKVTVIWKGKNVYLGNKCLKT